MRALLFAFVLVLTVSSYAMEEPVNLIDKNGWKQGVWMKKYQTGQLYYKGFFKDNYEVGEFLYYYPEGALQSRRVHSDKGRLCVAENFYESGSILSRGRYLNKQKDSTWNYYYDKSGKIIMVEHYDKGSRTGNWLIFGERGDTVEYTEWKNDKKNGLWIKKTEVYSLRAHYKDSKLEGTYEEWYPNGGLRVVGIYREDKKVGGWDYYDTEGIKRKFEMWREGEMADRVIYLRQTDGMAIPLSIYDIAYFYTKDSKALIVTRGGEEYLYDKDVNTLAELTESEIFLLLNVEKGIFVQKGSIRGVQYDNKKRVIAAQIEPESAVPLLPDADGKKALEALYREGMDE